MQRVRQVQVIAHRGASGYLPEHTLAAKAMAYAMGADYLEQDVVLSKDDIPLVLHDIHLDTISNVATVFPSRHRDDGRFYAIDFTVAEIKQLNATERFNPKTGKAVYSRRFPVQLGRFEIPTLAEELQLVQGLNQSTGKQVGIYPELKQPRFHHKEGKDLSRAVLNVLTEFGYTEQDHACLLQCFEAEELQRVRNDLGSRLFMVQLLSEAEWMQGAANSNERLRQLKEIASYSQAIGPAVGAVFREDPLGGLPVPTELTMDAHQQGLLIHPWTYRVDGLPKLFKSFADLHKATVLAGIDGIFSDFPDQSVQLLSDFT